MRRTASAVEENRISLIEIIYSVGYDHLGFSVKDEDSFLAIMGHR